MRSQHILTPDGSMEYTLHGSGPVVLICHGTSSDCHTDCFLDSLVEAGFTVLSPSRPGYGRTDLSTGISAAQAASSILNLLDQLNISSCNVIGISGGAPTAIALANKFPDRVRKLVLASAVSYPEHRPSEPEYQNQASFYGPMHSVIWASLGMVSRLSPRTMARQTMALFSVHDPDDALRSLSTADIRTIGQFYRGRSSRHGALADAGHTVGAELLSSITQSTLVIHSREDRSVPFAHAEWALQHIPQAELCEGGCTGHFLWVGPDSPRISRQLADFLLN
jgi:pimeloyl-ACP methyl ester carboxylesterase